MPTQGGREAARKDRPVRLQLSRRKGFDLQAVSLATNGLPAVNVARPSKWGNPYLVDDSNQWWARRPFLSRERAQGCVDHYERAIEEGFVLVPYTSLTPEERGDKWHSDGAHRVREVAPKYLRGHNLACWCGLCPAHATIGKPFAVACPDCAPCHADVLGRIACDDPTPTPAPTDAAADHAHHGDGQ